MGRVWSQNSFQRPCFLAARLGDAFSSPDCAISRVSPCLTVEPRWLIMIPMRSLTALPEPARTRTRFQPTVRLLTACCLQVAACGIIGKQLFSVWDFIFTSHCDNCRGTGRMICRNCRGTKTLRRRPGELHFVKGDLADQAAADLYALLLCLRYMQC